jgi:excisionase family DNA binding protein
VSVELSDDEARAVAALVARAIVAEAREHAARPTSQALALLRRLTQPMPAPGPENAAGTLSVAEAARRMACSPQYVRRLAAAGRIEAEKCGPVWLIRCDTTVSPPQPRGGGSASIAA